MLNTVSSSGKKSLHTTPKKHRKSQNILNSPYFKSISKYTSADSLGALIKKHESAHLENKFRKKEETGQSSKLIKKGAKHKLH